MDFNEEPNFCQIATWTILLALMFAFFYVCMVITVDQF
jgi:hypothetical protein